MWSQHTTKVGPQVFVVARGEVLKSREGCCAPAVQAGAVAQRDPRDTNTNSYVLGWAHLGCSCFQLVLKQTNKPYKVVTKTKQIIEITSICSHCCLG